MNLKFDGQSAEADFIAWRRTSYLDAQQHPELIVGEAKSLGRGDLIKPKDIAKLKAIATKLPGATIIVSVLRDKFTLSEEVLLQRFAKWGRRPDGRGHPTNPVILLTRHELFFDYSISKVWKAVGESHSKFSEYKHTRNLRGVAEATQQIYLGLPSFHTRQQEVWRRRAAQRKARRLKPEQDESAGIGKESPRPIGWGS